MKDTGWVTLLLNPDSWLRINKYLARKYGIEDTIMLSAHMNTFEKYGCEKYEIPRVQLEEMTTLSPRKQKDIEDRLIKRGVLIRTSEGQPRRNFYFVNSDVIHQENELLAEEIENS